MQQQQTCFQSLRFIKGLVFSFNGEILNQVDRNSMGYTLSLPLSNFNLSLENRRINFLSVLSPTYYRGYVDDILKTLNYKPDTLFELLDNFLKCSSKFTIENMIEKNSFVLIFRMKYALRIEAFDYE